MTERELPDVVGESRKVPVSVKLTRLFKPEVKADITPDRPTEYSSVSSPGLKPSPRSSTGIKSYRLPPPVLRLER